MPVKAPEIIEVSIPHQNIPTPVPVESSIAVVVAEVVIPEENHEAVNSVMADETGNAGIPVTEGSIVTQTEAKVSALSLKSIRAKKELEQVSKASIKEEAHLPTEAFNETDLLLQWTKYAQRLSDKGQKIMESLMLLSDPKLQGTTIVHELPNESAKSDFESGKHELVGYLRGKLHNHDIDIRIVVNESIDSRKAFTPQDRYNRLNEINPGLELLRKTFDLDF